MKKTLIRKIAVILAAVMVFGLLGFSAFAEDDPNGSVKVTNLPAEKLAEYTAANVGMDVYCLATWDYSTGKYDLTDAYKALEDVMVDITDKTEADAALAGKEAGQRALEATFAVDSKAVPVNGETPAAPDATVDKLPAGWYMIVLHGTDLEPKDYYKTIKDDEDNDVHVTIALSSEIEYRFSPILLTVGDETEPVLFEIKSEEAPRFGKLRITKSVERYHASEPVNFVFHITGRDEAGTIKYEDYTGLNFPEQKSVVVERIPADLMITVNEIYTGSAYVQVEADPEPFKIKAGETAEVDLEEDGSITTVGFTNTYNEEEQHGYGIVNRFKYNVDGWDFYQDGELQPVEGGQPEA